MAASQGLRAKGCEPRAVAASQGPCACLVCARAGGRCLSSLRAGGADLCAHGWCGEQCVDFATLCFHAGVDFATLCFHAGALFTTLSFHAGRDFATLMFSCRSRFRDLDVFMQVAISRP